MEEIKQLVQQVDSFAGNAEQALAAEKKAKAEYLRAALKAIGKRALMAIGTRPVVKKKSHNCDVNCSHRDEVEYWGSGAEDRLVLLSADKVGPYRTAHNGTGGIVEGLQLYVSLDGRFVELSYEGTYTRWQNGWNEWEATGRTYAGTDFDAEMVVEDGWTEVEEYVARLQKRLQEYVDGGVSKRIGEMRERAERLSAAATLLK